MTPVGTLVLGGYGVGLPVPTRGDDGVGVYKSGRVGTPGFKFEGLQPNASNLKQSSKNFINV